MRKFQRITVLTLTVILVALVSRGECGEFESSIQPLLSRYCVRCHGKDEQQARVRFDRLVKFDATDQPLWTKVHEAVGGREMPPEGETQPTEAERKTLVSWIRECTVELRRSLGGTSRRLNRREYSAALRDLTGLPIDFAAALPADSKTDGFDTGAAGLQDAADSVAQLLEVSRRAVDGIRFLDPDPDRRIQIDFREHGFTDFRKFVDARWKDRGIFTKSKRLLCKQDVGVYLPTQWTGERGNSFLAVPAPADKRSTHNSRHTLSLSSSNVNENSLQANPTRFARSRLGVATLKNGVGHFAFIIDCEVP